MLQTVTVDSGRYSCYDLYTHRSDIVIIQFYTSLCYSLWLRVCAVRALVTEESQGFMSDQFSISLANLFK